MCVCVCVCVCLCVFICVIEPSARAEFNRMKRKLMRSKQRENLRWHSAATRWPVNANFNNSLIIGVRAPLDHFLRRVSKQDGEERGRRSREIGILSNKI